MEQTASAVQDRTSLAPAEQIEAGRNATSPLSPASAVSPQACASCGTAPAVNGGLPVIPPCIYVIGHIEPRFPQLSIEKEARQVIARAGGAISLAGEQRGRRVQ